MSLRRNIPPSNLTCFSGDRITDLAEGSYDLAIRTGALEDMAGVIARRIARHRMLVCASPSYLDRYGHPQQLEDLGSHNAIIYSRPGWVHPGCFREMASLAEVTPPNRLRLDDLDAIADAATAGMGLAWLPSWLIRERVEAGPLAPLLPDQPAYVFDNYALWLQTPHLPLKIRLAVDALASAFTPSSWRDAGARSLTSAASCQNAGRAGSAVIPGMTAYTVCHRLRLIQAGIV